MTLTARCHCGSTRIDLPTPTEAKRCNCTFCHRLGALWAYFPPEAVTITAHPDAIYAPGSGLNAHHFCGRCGNHLYGLSPDWGSVYNMDGTPKAGFTADSIPETRILAVNLNMVDDLDVSGLTIKEMDGRNNW